MVAPGFLKNPTFSAGQTVSSRPGRSSNWTASTAFVTNPRPVIGRSGSNPTSPDRLLGICDRARNAQILLRRAAQTDGLKLTATGNMSRAVVAEMCRTIEWPDYDKEELFRFSKVINETDYLHLHLFMY